MEAKAKELAKELVDKFEEEWKPVADNLGEAMKAFDDLEGNTDAASPWTETCKC
jgi:hypothetical protein